jgi:hypothetical protein
MFRDAGAGQDELTVTQRGLFGLARAMIVRRQRVELAQLRGDVMIDVVTTVAAAGVAARISSVESDARWSMEIIPAGSASIEPVIQT